MDSRRNLPAVQALLDEAEQDDFLSTVPRSVLVDTVRSALEFVRQGGEKPDNGWIAEIRRRVERTLTPNLKPVINATGVVLHTNLGRAPLAQAAREAISRVSRYSTLEYDIDTGERGSRHSHVRDSLLRLTGAEDAIVVNNAAAAMIVVLNSLACGGETIVSRGELVEIGGSFRIPEILEKSGSTLVEVGTTNRTRVSDYLAAVGSRTRAALKVHRSNFRISGFVEEAPLADIVRCMEPKNIAVIHDVGSGLLLDLSDFGLNGEPLVANSLKAGAVTVFSGDKLLGGPQCGIIAGPKAAVTLARKNPFTRAMRPGKTVLAALEATLSLYRDRDVALREIPVLRMLTMPASEIENRAKDLASRIPSAETRAGSSSVGGGSFPDAQLSTTVIVVRTSHPDRELKKLRELPVPIVARADSDGILLDPRTILESEEEPVVSALSAVG